MGWDDTVHHSGKGMWWLVGEQLFVMWEPELGLTQKLQSLLLGLMCSNQAVPLQVPQYPKTE